MSKVEIGEESMTFTEFLKRMHNDACDILPSAIMGSDSIDRSDIAGFVLHRINALAANMLVNMADYIPENSFEIYINDLREKLNEGINKRNEYKTLRDLTKGTMQ